MARRFRPPVSLKRLTHEQKRTGNENKTIVVVGTVTDDERLVNVPKITVSRSMLKNELFFVFRLLLCTSLNRLVFAS